MKLNTDEAVLLGLVGYLVLTPVLQYEPYGIDHLYNVKRYLQVALLMLVGSSLIFSSNLRNQVAEFAGFFSTKVHWVLGGVILIGGISGFLAEYQDWAFLEYGHWLLMGVAAFVVGSIAYKNPDKAVMYVSVAVLAYIFFFLCRVSFFYILHHWADIPLWPGDINRKALYSFSHVRFLNQTQTWVIPIAASLGWFYWHYSKQKIYKWGIAALIVGWGVLVFASGGRGTMLGVTAGVLVVWLFFIKQKWKFFKYCFLLAVCSVITYYMFFELLAGGTRETIERVSSSGRIDNWIALIPEILAKPFFGYGPMHYASVALDNAWGHTHNWFLQFAYEWGIVVAMSLLVMFAYGLYRTSRQLKLDSEDISYDQKEYWIRIGLYWSVLAAFIHGFFSGVFVMPLSQTWFVLVAGSFLGLYMNKEHTTNFKEQNTSGKIQLLIVLLVLIGIAGITNWGINHPLNRSKVDQEFYNDSPSGKSHPRYWQQGKFKD